MRRVRLSVVILNYQRARFTETAARSALAQLGGDEPLVVIDNGSGDGSLGRLRAALAPRAFVMDAGGNRGFAGGVNVGLRVRHHPPVDACVLLNNDATLAPGALDALRVHLRAHPRHGLVGGRVIDAADGSVHDPGGGTIDYLTGSVRARPGGRLDFVTGAFMAIRREVLEQGLYLPERYFMYFEDVAYSLRVRDHGWELGYCPEAIVLHEGAGTLGRASVLGDVHFITSGVHFFLTERGRHPIPAVAFLVRRVLKRLWFGPRRNVPAILRAWVAAWRTQGVRSREP